MGSATLIAQNRAARVPVSTEPLGDAVVRKIRRLGKYARRLTLNAVSGAPETRVLFIVGAQRSGTRVPLVALESAPDILTYREGARPFFERGRLVPDAALQRLFEGCPFPVLVLKPLCESHRGRELLDRFPGSRVLWIFRGYEDTVDSASLKWKSGVEAIERLVTNRLPPNDWRRGGLTPELYDAAKDLYEPGLSLHHANAIMWYLRSRLLLDQGLCDRPDVLVVKYEDLSSDPQTHFPALFEFVGQPLKMEYLEKIHNRSGRRTPFPALPRRVIEACEELYVEIDRRYQSTRRRQG